MRESITNAANAVWSSIGEVVSRGFNWIDERAPEFHEQYVEPKVEQAARLAGAIMMDASEAVVHVSRGIRNMGSKMIEFANKRED